MFATYDPQCVATVDRNFEMIRQLAIEVPYVLFDLFCCVLQFNTFVILCFSLLRGPTEQVGFPLCNVIFLYLGHIFESIHYFHNSQ